MAALLEIQNLSKTYRKARQPALQSLSLAVEEGAIYAFVGPNGAGKTTTLQIVATLLEYKHGSVRVGGYEVQDAPGDVRRLLGYIPDEFGLYGDMLVHEYLRFFARCYHIPPERQEPIVRDLLDLVGLARRADDEVQSLSRGMRQRLGLARALVHDPRLIVADEPAAGLDPRARVELREIFRGLQEMGKTVFLSSHVLRELDDIATHIGIIEGGHLVASGPIEQVRAQLRPHYRVHIRLLSPPAGTALANGAPQAHVPSADDAHAWLVARPNVLTVEPLAPAVHGGQLALPGFEVNLEGDAPAVAQLLADMVAAGFPIFTYTEELDTLESMFMNLTRGGVT